MIVERILILIRNILDISPSIDEEKRTDDDASVHDQVICRADQQKQITSITFE